MPCRMLSETSLRDPLLYCAESALDHHVKDPTVREEFRRTIETLLGGALSSENYSLVLKKTASELIATIGGDEEVAAATFGGMSPHQAESYIHDLVFELLGDVELRRSYLSERIEFERSGLHLMTAADRRCDELRGVGVGWDTKSDRERGHESIEWEPLTGSVFNPADDAAIIARLSTGTIDSVRLLDQSVIREDYSDKQLNLDDWPLAVVTFTDGSMAALKFPAQPYHGADGRPHGRTAIEAQVAAFHFDRLLGFNRVPPTAARTLTEAEV